MRSDASRSKGANSVLFKAVTLYLTHANSGVAIVGASAYLDDALAGTTDSRGRPVILGVSAGTHQLIIHKDGCNTLAIAIMVQTNTFMILKMKQA